jgi:hypothetical protein
MTTETRCYDLRYSVCQRALPFLPRFELWTGWDDPVSAGLRVEGNRMSRATSPCAFGCLPRRKSSLYHVIVLYSGTQSHLAVVLVVPADAVFHVLHNSNYVLPSGPPDSGDTILVFWSSTQCRPCKMSLRVKEKG